MALGESVGWERRGSGLQVSPGDPLLVMAAILWTAMSKGHSKGRRLQGATPLPNGAMTSLFYTSEPGAGGGGRVREGGREGECMVSSGFMDGRMNVR